MAYPKSRDGIASLFRSRDAERIREFILGCPEFPLREQAVQLASMNIPGAPALALGMVGQGLAFGRDPDFGAEVALAAHDVAREAFDEHGPEVILPVTLSRIAFEALHALNTAGRHNDCLRQAKQFIELYGDDPENGPSIRVSRITSLVALNRIEEARDAIAEETARETTGPAKIELNRLQDVLARMSGEATALAPERVPTTASAELAAENERLRRVLDMGTEFLTGSSEELNEWTATKLIRDGTAIFTHPTRGRDPDLIRESVEKLAVARRWAKKNNSIQNENDALWGLYLCFSRLEQPSAAADALLDLRDNIEAARAEIIDPIERGGIAGTYPYLYPALCRMLALADRPLDLLEAMEGAKGRAVADLLAGRLGELTDERQLSRPARHVPELMRREGAHYLSCFVDDTDTYAVLVDKNGTVRSAGCVPLGKQSIRSAAGNVDPRSWGVNLVDPLGPAQESPNTLLSPILNWLEPLLDSGDLENGDHICYSPDEHLHHVPLHYVNLKGAPLVNRFSVSRVHGAHTLALLLAQPASRPTGSYVAFVVPTKGERDRMEFLEGLHRAVSWLDRTGEGRVFQGEAARFDSLRELNLTNTIVHFATHGVFPSVGTPRDENPYTGSGLLLAGSDGLPDENAVARGEVSQVLLSPERIMEAELIFSGSHVTLQACVTGLAEEGIGGDALGMDWALTQAGAVSRLVSHWNVSAVSASEFYVHFYSNWIDKGMSRKDAWRATILELQRPGSSYGIYDWAPFSLSGDWR
ncbi:MAG: CHAT domain-containing protein [Candidatus Hydrogenedentota bacterium]|nr:MAG: CHAT domain-containing protein [Candidatus Hydrogenedentota bacterium]